MIPIGNGKKLEEYYNNVEDDEKKQRQERTNELSSTLHPIATLHCTKSGKKFRIEFFQTHIEKEIYAKVRELFDDFMKNKDNFIVLKERSIFHSGYFHSTSVGDMKEEEKIRFVSNISKMNVRSLDIFSENKTIYIW